MSTHRRARRIGTRDPNARPGSPPERRALQHDFPGRIRLSYRRGHLDGGSSIGSRQRGARLGSGSVRCHADRRSRGAHARNVASSAIRARKGSRQGEVDCTFMSYG